MEQLIIINVQVKLVATCDELEFYEETKSKMFYNFNEDATVGDLKRVVLADEGTLKDDGMIYTCLFKISVSSKT